ncbi:MAG: NAD-dependent epimerase/dehydratase family protein [Deltaproteobacteria bacterium]|nr:NAD-dependent epimerase/dehydratase family protein [Deltaproteobacteria bacterium]
MTAPRVLLTGGAGFLGVRLARELLDRGYHVKVLDIEKLDSPDIEEDVELVRRDIRDRDAVDNATRGMDYVVHGVAVQPVSRSSRDVFWDINVKGTENALRAALEQRVKKFIYISSSAPYGVPSRVPITEETGFGPVCDYGRSKVAAERICNEFRKKGLDVVILRPRVLIGRGRLGIYQMLYNWIADSNRIYILGRGDNLFQPLSGQDMVDACILSLETNCKNQNFNLGAEEFGTFRGDLQHLVDHADSKSTIVSIPALPAKAALFSLDVFHLSPLTPWHYLTCDAPFYYDTSKARKMLGWRPRINSAGMYEASYDWYVSHRKEVDSKLGTTHRRSLKQRLFKVIKRFS